MRYDGSSFDDAVAKFAAKITATLPGASCGGWNWAAPIDPERIRQSIDE
jgi:hypothetical protein